MVNRLDRLVGWYDPVRGAKRAQARLAIAHLGYDAGKRDRGTDGWVTVSADADGTLGGVASLVRDRARDLARNNPYATAAVDVKVTETIGKGIIAELPKGKLADRWQLFTETCDFDDHHDFAGIQSLTERCRMESGECLVVFTPVERTAHELSLGMLPLQLRVLEPDYLDGSRDGQESDGGSTRFGIRYNASHKVEGYWLFPEHPGQTSVAIIHAAGLHSEFHDAADVIHIFRKLRPGQTRGVSEFVSAMLRMRNLDDYDDAEIMRKKIEACLAVFVTSPNGSNVGIGTPDKDNTGRIDQVYPAMIEYLKHGEEVTTAEPKASGGYADFQRFQLRAIATGIGIPYELISGDLSQINYASYRAGLIRFQRRLAQDQNQIHVPNLCRRVFSRFLVEANGVNGRPMPNASKPVTWTPPRFELMDPIKETQADIAAVQAGFETWDEIVRRRGWNAAEQIEQIEVWQKMLKDKEIILTSNAANNAGLSAQRFKDPEDNDAETPETPEKAA